MILSPVLKVPTFFNLFKGVGAVTEGNLYSVCWAGQCCCVLKGTLCLYLARIN
jgi:hypothetical protein